MTPATEAPACNTPTPHSIPFSDGRHQDDTRSLSTDIDEAWASDVEVYDDSEDSSSSLAPAAASRWVEIATLQSQYILGQGAVDMLCLSLATAHCARQAETSDSSVWLFIIGKPSTGKSETVRLLRSLPSLLFRDELTAKAFSSGSKDERNRKVPSLLDKLDKKCLVMSDMAAFFEQKEETVRGILGTMTQAFDGTYDKATGTVGDLTHVAHFGWLGVTTPSHHARFEGFLRQLGPRVLAYRVPALTNEQRKGIRTVARASGRNALKEQLTKALTVHFDQLAKTTIPSTSPEIYEVLDQIDEMLGRGRGIITGTGQDADVQTEGAGRSSQQFNALLRAIAQVRGHTTVAPDDLALVRRVALGSIPQDRAVVIAYLAQHQTDTTVNGLVQATGKSRMTVQRTLDELILLELAVKGPTVGQSGEQVYLADQVVIDAFSDPKTPQ